MVDDFDDLERIADATKFATAVRKDARGQTRGSREALIEANLVRLQRMNRIERSKGMFARVKRKPVTLPALPPFKEE